MLTQVGVPDTESTTKSSLLSAAKEASINEVEDAVPAAGAKLADNMFPGVPSSSCKLKVILRHIKSL